MKNKENIISVVGMVLSTVLLVVCASLVEDKIVNPTMGIVLLVISTILFFISVCFMLKVDYKTGVYECRKCGHVFKPTFNAYLWGSHSMTTRYLKCPMCEEKSWCKRLKSSS